MKSSEEILNSSFKNDIRWSNIEPYEVNYDRGKTFI